MSRAGRYDIIAEQGARLRRTISYEQPDGTPVDLTDYTARMQVRRQEYAPTADIELTTENGGITIDGPNGTVTLRVDATEMAAVRPMTGYYDLELVPPSGEDFAFRLIEGTFQIKRNITREVT